MDTPSYTDESPTSACTHVQVEEGERLDALYALSVLDSAGEPFFDNLVETAALLCETPIAVISMVDEQRVWFKASTGLGSLSETPRDIAPCSCTIDSTSLLVVHDASKDARFADSPLVTAYPYMQFYAGAVLRLGNGAHVGTLAVMDTRPRRLSQCQRDALMRLATTAVQGLESRRDSVALNHNAARFRSLSESAPLGVFATDADGACTYTNARWQALYDMTQAKAAGHGWVSRIHPDDRAAVFNKWKERQSLGQDFDMQFRVQQRNGRVLHLRTLSRPVLSDNGLIVGHVGSVEDVTERRIHTAALHKNEALLKETGSLAEVGGWELDLISNTLTWSEQTCRIHGVPTSFRIHQRKALDFFAPEARLVMRHAMERAIADGTCFDLELPLIQASGTRIWVRSVGHAEMHGDKPVRLVGAIQNITRSVQQRQALENARELLHVTLQSIGDAVITSDADGLVTWLNPVAERLTGWTLDQATGLPLMRVFRIIDQHTRKPILDLVSTCLQQGRRVGFANQTVLISRAGQEFGIEDSAAPICNAVGQVLGAVLVFRDVTEQRRLSGEMHYRATHDALTGLVNRTEFEAWLTRTVSASHKGAGQSALMYIDLDQFKVVNDACGHAVGDQLLVQVASLLSGSLLSPDTLARLGGDEFAVILENCNSEQAMTAAQQICDHMDDFRFVNGDRRFRIGASIGLVMLDQHWGSAAAAMQAADIACYAAKEAGRNRVHLWYDTDRAMRTRRVQTQWASRIEQSLDDDRFVLYAQRIQLLNRAGAGLHAEVLVRMLDDDGSLIMPNTFLPAAERFHLATRLDRWVLWRAIEELVVMPDLNGLDALHVNVSGQSIGDRVFHRDVLDVFTAAGPEVCERICLEITETAVVTNMADAVVFIDQARELGVRIALDDFGAGASSFGYLKTLPVSMLKIDGQFIRHLIEDPLDDAAVRCFVDVARVVGVKTVAEYVDRPEVLQRLQEVGIDYAQGYLMHKPDKLRSVLALGPSPADVPEMIRQAAS